MSKKKDVEKDPKVLKVFEELVNYIKNIPEEMLKQYAQYLREKPKNKNLPKKERKEIEKNIKEVRNKVFCSYKEFSEELANAKDGVNIHYHCQLGGYFGEVGEITAVDPDAPCGGVILSTFVKRKDYFIPSGGYFHLAENMGLYNKDGKDNQIDEKKRGQLREDVKEKRDKFILEQMEKILKLDEDDFEKMRKSIEEKYGEDLK